VVKVISQNASSPLHTDKMPITSCGDKCTRPPWAIMSPQRRWWRIACVVAGGDSRPTCPFLKKLPLCMGDLDHSLIHGSLGPPKSTTQTASFCRAHDCDKQITLHTTWSVTLGCIYICSTVMRPNNTSNLYIRHTVDPAVQMDQGRVNG